MKLNFIDVLAMTKSANALFRLVPNSFLIGYFIISGYRRKSLSFDGMLMALLVALVTAYCSQTFTFLLLSFYYSSSKLTKYKSSVKATIEDSHQEGGNRNYVQVLSNSLPAVVFGLLYFFTTPRQTSYIDYQTDYWGSAMIVGVIAHYACCNGDTWASELGILSKSDPILITKMRRVPKGTNGGVSTLGLTASLLGGLFIGIIHYISTIATGYYYPKEVALLDTSNQFLKSIIISSLAGFFGSILDSVMGATLQLSVYHGDKKVVLCDENISKSKNSDFKVISGKKILDNHQVNFISSLLTATLFALFIGKYIF